MRGRTACGGNLDSFQAQRWDAVLAGATITSLPILILYLAIQRKFVESLTMTGLKG